MYTRILAALDNSDASERVFEQALELAQTLDAQLMLIHGLTSDEDGSPTSIPPDVGTNNYWVPGTMTEITFDVWRKTWERYETEGVERLQRFAAIANQANVNTEFRQVMGNPGKIICHTAQAWNADLIVIGHRGRSGLTELMLGSVSNYVVHRAPCSVLVLKAGTVPGLASEQQTGAEVYSR